MKHTVDSAVGYYTSKEMELERELRKLISPYSQLSKDIQCRFAADFVEHASKLKWLDTKKYGDVAFVSKNGMQVVFPNGSVVIHVLRSLGWKLISSGGRGTAFSYYARDDCSWPLSTQWLSGLTYLTVLNDRLDTKVVEQLKQMDKR